MKRLLSVENFAISLFRLVMVRILVVPRAQADLLNYESNHNPTALTKREGRANFSQNQPCLTQDAIFVFAI
ncbi:MAG: hypothetical protein WAW39_29515 [Prosthecobacter sp.]|uniref:hypothetical protein n=1 Tax=Prosthecobacter sp. TaxID=1965333 RepID=UPI003BB1D690